MTTAKAGPWVSDPQIYREKLFKLLGDRNPLEVLAQTASTLGEIVLEHPATVLRARPSEGRWTANEVIGHLADGEWVYGYRVRLILCEDNPTILGTNQDFWVARQRHNEREPSELVDMFRTMRQLNLALWRRMSAADWARAGQHNERGPESLGVLLRMTAGHDLSHLDQITRCIQAVRPRPSGRGRKWTATIRGSGPTPSPGFASPLALRRQVHLGIGDRHLAHASGAHHHRTRGWRRDEQRRASGPRAS